MPKKRRANGRNKPANARGHVRALSLPRVVATPSRPRAGRSFDSFRAWNTRHRSTRSADAVADVFDPSVSRSSGQARVLRSVRLDGAQGQGREAVPRQEHRRVRGHPRSSGVLRLRRARPTRRRASPRLSPSPSPSSSSSRAMATRRRARLDDGRPRDATRRAIEPSRGARPPAVRAPIPPLSHRANPNLFASPIFAPVFAVVHASQALPQGVLLHLRGDPQQDRPRALRGGAPHSLAAQAHAPPGQDQEGREEGLSGVDWKWRWLRARRDYARGRVGGVARSVGGVARGQRLRADAPGRAAWVRSSV